MAIEHLIENALLAIAGAGVAGVVAQVFLSYMSQRAQNDILAQGLQAVVGTNTIDTVDDSMDDRDTAVESDK
jgi:hypothetical protein